MNNEFKLRLYKKTGAEKGNLDKELFYDSAKELWTTYKSLLRKSDYSINLNRALYPTIWVRSGEEDWTRYGEADFAKFFLGGKRQIDIISENIKYTDELCVDLEKEIIEADWELWINVDRYFGTDTGSDDETWINFYTYWHSNGRVTAVYEIDSEETSKVIDWPLTDKEEEFFLLKMEEYALKKEHCSLENLFQFEKEHDALWDDAGTSDSYLHKVGYNFLLRANYERWDGTGEMPVTFNKEYYCTYRAGIPGGILRLSVTEDNSEWKYVISCIGIRSTGEEITKTESIPIRANDAELEYGLKKLISEFKETFSEQLYCYKGVSYPVGPLTKKAVCRYKDDNNYIRGIVKVELSDLIENDLDGFLDLISEKLTRSPLLMDIGYEPVSVFEEELYLLVSGDVSGILDEEQNNGEDGNE
ncbi:hypothetical protein [Blautia obeum]|uniref:Uncharacterized protein n=1 Tax=Blautia obeum TaxID=40520 RepID=A0A174PQC1_9FIRM|nr:hypothetical protein [Blautia obeum]CUP61781.1 Uncharacterised protein [Blautia obeum]